MSLGHTDAPAYPKGIQIPPQPPESPLGSTAASAIQQTLALLTLSDSDLEETELEVELHPQSEFTAVVTDTACKCVMHLLSHHAPTGAWYFVDTISSSIIVIVCTSGIRPYRHIPR